MTELLAISYLIGATTCLVLLALYTDRHNPLPSLLASTLIALSWPFWLLATLIIIAYAWKASLSIKQLND